MATYCTANDVRAALTPGGVTDQNQSAASLEDWQIQDAIDEAEGLVNSYLSGYVTPVPVINYLIDDPDDPNNGQPYQAASDPVRRWTRTVAAYLASLTFRISKDLADEDPIVRRYNMTLDLLKDVRAGLITLDPDLFPATEGSSHQVGIFNLYEGTLFGPEDFDLTPNRQGTQLIIPTSTEFPDGFSG